MLLSNKITYSPFIFILLFYNIQSRLLNSIPFHSFLFYSFPLLKYILLNSIFLYSLMIILFHSIPLLTPKQA